MYDKIMDWFKRSLYRVKESIVKFLKICRLKIEIASLTKKIDEKYKRLGRKTFLSIEEGEFGEANKAQFEPDFTELSDLLKNAEYLRDKIEEISGYKRIEVVDIKNEDASEIGELDNRLKIDSVKGGIEKKENEKNT